MDFLDYLAHLLTPNKRRKAVEIDEGVEDIVPQHSSLCVKEAKRLLRSRKSFAEAKFSVHDKVLNDKYAEESKFGLRKRVGRSIQIEDILPFLDGKKEWSEWAYRNRYGVFITVALYLSILFGFSMMSFSVGVPENIEGIVIEFVEESDIDVESEELTEQENFESADIQNLISDVNSSSEEDYFESSVSPMAEKLFKEAEQLEAETKSNLLSYYENMDSINRKLEEERQAIQRRLDSINRKQISQELNTHSRKSGNVTVSFDLEGRKALFMEIPAYLCEGGGKVIVWMEVGRDGKVISAFVRTSYGVTDSCVEEMAVWATKQALFDTRPSAPLKQRGTMTYIFIPQ